MGAAAWVATHLVKFGERGFVDAELAENPVKQRWSESPDPHGSVSSLIDRPDAASVRGFRFASTSRTPACGQLA
jgi:hypothetical protein